MKAFELWSAVIRKRQSQRQAGQNVMLAVAIMIGAVMFGAFAVDTGTYYTIYSQMQAAADSSALAGIQTLMKDSTQDPNTRLSDAQNEAVNYADLNWGNIIDTSSVDYGWVDPTTMKYDPSNFSSQQLSQYPESDGYNAIRVNVVRNSSSPMGQIPTTFANIFGIKGMDTTAQAVAMFPGQPSAVTGGIRPFFMCQAAYDIALKDYNDASVPEITFYGTTFSVGNNTYNVSDYCPCTTGNGSSCKNPPGSWGLADPSGANGAPGSTDIQNWIENGYSGTVSNGETLNPQTGTGGLQSSSSELQGLVNNQTVFTVPMYSSATGQGNGATFQVTELASFQLTDYNTAGGQNSYLKGYFKKQVCSAAMCSYTNNSTYTGGSLSTIRLVH